MVLTVPDAAAYEAEVKALGRQILAAVSEQRPAPLQPDWWQSQALDLADRLQTPVFVLTDLINEYFGRRGVRLVSWLAVAFIAWAFLAAWIAIHLAPAGFWLEANAAQGVPDIQRAYALIFGQGMWTIAGSVTAFLIGQLVDVQVFHRIRRATGERLIWLRATGSTAVSQLIDSFIVLYIAFVIGPQQWGWGLFLAVATVNYAYKMLAAIALIPLLYVMRRVIRRYLGAERAEDAHPPITDLVPESLRGRFSGVKALLELPVPLIFTSFVVANMVAQGNLWAALVTLSVVLLVCMALSMLIREQPIDRPQRALDWRPIARLALMTGAFTVVILGAGAGVNLIMAWVASLTGSLVPVLTVVFGVVGMGIAVLIGVWLSVSLSLGKDVRHHASFTWWVTSRLAFLVGSMNLASFMLYFMQERFVELAGERAAGPSARVMMFVGVFIMVTALPSGWLADRFGKRPLVAVSAVLAAGGTFFILLVPTMPAMYVGGSMIGAAMGLFYSANWALGTEIVPQDRAGQFLGISNLAGAGAGAIGAYIGGPIADANGYVLLFVIYGLMFLLSILALMGVKEQRGYASA